MDIACVVRRSFPGPGGIATALRVVARELARRHHVRVWAARVDAAPLTRLNATLGAQSFAPMWIDHVEVRPVPMGISGIAAAVPMSLMAVPGLRRVGYGALRRATAPAYVHAVAARLAEDWGEPHVVHCWGGEALNWAAGRAALEHSRPLVVTPFAHPGAWGDDDMNVAFYKSADAVCALLPSEAALYAALGIDESKIHVVGVPVTPLPKGGPDVRAAYGIDDAPLVLFLGVKEPYKGYRALLEAAPAVWAEVPDARFAFVGPRTEASKADFAEVDDDRIVEVGMVADDVVAAWHRAASVYCLPSTSEIMPVAILEAWQYETPVVAAEWWCARDLITHERDGIIVPAQPNEPPDPAAIASALIQMLRDPSGARDMGIAGREMVSERYSPAAVGARHEDVYLSVMP
ncbi:MAG: glycosyltransferase family 4 protein [Actinomycetota bacterium]